MNTKRNEKGKKILLIRARTLNFPLSIYFSSIRLAVVEKRWKKRNWLIASKAILLCAIARDFMLLFF